MTPLQEKVEAIFTSLQNDLDSGHLIRIDESDIAFFHTRFQKTPNEKTARLLNSCVQAFLKGIENANTRHVESPKN